ncbi:hypothetical protein ACFLX2_00815 [Candidatus Dependentiae bacterium]
MSGANEQPGMALVKALVSLDRLEEAEREIKKMIDESFKEIEPQEFEQAQLAIINSLVDHFESNERTAISFIFLDKYGLPADYFDKRAEVLSKLTIDEVKAAVKNVLNSKNMMVVRIGRVGQKTATA